MANLATQEMDLDGLVATYSAAAGGGDTFTPDNDVFLHIKNAHTSSWTVTVSTPGTLVSGQLAKADAVCTVANGTERFMGPFPPQEFADPSTGLASITYSGVTALTVAVIKAPVRL